MKWSSFTVAAEKLINMAGTCLPGFEVTCETTAKALMQSQKFYFPGSENVINGKKISDIKDLLHLPYECISVLSECPVEGVEHRTITIAINSTSEFAKTLRGPNHVADPEGAWCYLIGLIYLPHYNEWCISGPICCVCKRDDDIGLYVLNNMLGQRFLKERTDAGASEMLNDLDIIMNICVFLNFKNVKEKIISAPKFVNMKRLKNKKLPLYDYKVLVVDGMTWDKKQEPQSEEVGHGYRSHLRRGHVRRIENGGRVWVRASYIHGKIEGFVNKDYESRV